MGVKLAKHLATQLRVINQQDVRFEELPEEQPKTR